MVRGSFATRSSIVFAAGLRPTSEGKRVRLSPAKGSVFGGQIEFANAVIGKQYFETTLVNGNFRHDLSEARTFGFLRDVEALRAAGLAGLGAGELDRLGRAHRDDLGRLGDLLGLRRAGRRDQPRLDPPGVSRPREAEIGPPGSRKEASLREPRPSPASHRDR